jgi:hypothetical protein
MAFDQNDIVRANAWWTQQKLSFECCLKVATDQGAEIPYLRQSSDLRSVSESSRLSLVRGSTIIEASIAADEPVMLVYAAISLTMGIAMVLASRKRLLVISLLKAVSLPPAVRLSDALE